MPSNRAIVRSIEALGYVIGGNSNPAETVLSARKGEEYHEVGIEGDGEMERYRAWVALAIAVGIDVEDG